jgi:hypothetical protein
MSELNEPYVDAKPWILVGSSPSATEWWPMLRERLPRSPTITTNRGISLFKDDDPPSVYFFGDERLHNPDQFEEWKQAAQRIQPLGTHIVGLSRKPEVLDEWGIRFLDEFLKVELGCWRPWKFIPGKYTACHLSGLFCLQYVVNQGASEVHLTGVDGYSDDAHYYDSGGDSQAAKDGDVTATVIQPFTQAVVDACPKTQFMFYGDLNYTIVGGNVAIVKDPSTWNSNSSDTGGASGPGTSETSPTGPQMC